jgi:hypothetical protein
MADTLKDKLQDTMSRSMEIEQLTSQMIKHRVLHRLRGLLLEAAAGRRGSYVLVLEDSHLWLPATLTCSAELCKDSIAQWVGEDPELAAVFEGQNPAGSLIFSWCIITNQGEADDT